jgi:hypothetical protein
MNLSGFGNNKVFKTGIDPAAPYYTVSASLDLADAVYDGTYFFNFENSLAYTQLRDFNNFVIIDENSVIGDVAVYADPPIESVDDQEVYFSIGGANYQAPVPDNAVKVWWAAPPGFGPYIYPSVSKINTVARNNANVATIVTTLPHQLLSGMYVDISGVTTAGFNANGVSITVTSPLAFTYNNTGVQVSPPVSSTTGFVSFAPDQGNPFFNGYPLDVSEVNASSVNQFGHEGGHFPYEYDPVSLNSDSTKRYKFLAVTLLGELPDTPVPYFPQQNAEESKDGEVIIINEDATSAKSEIPERKRKTLFRGLPIGEKAIVKGRLVVTMKVYPKSQ